MESHCKAFLDAAQDMLGPEETRTRDKVLFETFPGVKKTSPTTHNRAYTLADTMQRQNSVQAPNAGSKVYNGDMDERRKIQKRTTTVSTTRQPHLCANEPTGCCNVHTPSLGKDRAGTHAEMRSGLRRGHKFATSRMSRQHELSCLPSQYRCSAERRRR